MRRQYYGKTCPYCKTPLKEGDVIAVCGTCDMPHHLSCWQANQSCTTFGCSGTIREIIGLDTPPHSPSGHSERATPWRAEESVLTETLSQNNDPILMTDLPLLLEQTAILQNRTQNKLFARCVFRNLSPTPIQAALVEIACQDVWGSDLGDPVPFQYLDLKTPRNGQFGQAVPVELPDKNARRIRLMVKKLLLADGTILSGSGETCAVPAPIPLTQQLGNDLAAEYARQTTPKARFVPTQIGAYRRCACGSYHTEETCPTCGSPWNKLLAALDVETLRAGIAAKQAAAEAQRIAREKAQAEQAERIRQAQEQFRREQEARARELQLAAEAEERAKKEKRRKRRKITLAITIPLLVLALGVFTWLFGIPYYHYRVALNALENEQFLEAHQGFTQLGDFLDSEEMAQETQYQQADDAMGSGNYAIAMNLYTELGDYKDSADRAMEAKYRLGMQQMANKEYETAITTFTSLGNYLASTTHIQECKYQQATQLLEKKEYKAAFLLFSELKSYQDSGTQANNTLSKWATAAMESSTSDMARDLSKSVAMRDGARNEVIYNVVHNYISSHDWVSHWFTSGTGATAKTISARLLLNMVSSGYKNTNKYLSALGLFSTYKTYKDIFKNCSGTVKACMSVGFVKDMVASDEVITLFLTGTWTGSGYSMVFYDRNGTTYSHNTLPTPPDTGSQGYFILGQIYYWTGDYNSTKVFRFEIVNYNTIKVFCYSNNRTYTLTRN